MSVSLSMAFSRVTSSEIVRSSSTTSCEWALRGDTAPLASSSSSVSLASETVVASLDERPRRRRRFFFLYARASAAPSPANSAGSGSSVLAVVVSSDTSALIAGRRRSSGTFDAAADDDDDDDDDGSMEETHYLPATTRPHTPVCHSSYQGRRRVDESNQPVGRARDRLIDRSIERRARNNNSEATPEEG